MPTKEELTAQVEELQTEVTSLTEDKEARESSDIPSKIAAWLTISTNVKVQASDIIPDEIKADKVTYRRRVEGRLDNNIFGIMTTKPFSDDLVPVPAHEHTFTTRSSEQPTCSCGKSEE